MNVFKDSFSEEVWTSTYKHHSDNTVQDTWRRVAKAVASVEKTPELQKEWEDKFYEMLENFKVVPGGRIMANAGTDFHGTTLLNCFVNGYPEEDIDSIKGIYKMLEEQALVLKSEGGFGANFSVLRPRGTFIAGIGVDSPGAIKFLELFDKSSEIITSGSGEASNNKKAKGKIRKGAMMAVMDIWHPDIIEFITAKQTPGRLTKFNMSVNVTNKFINKITGTDQDDNWNLIFPDTTFEKYKEEWRGDIEDWQQKGYPVIIYKTVSAKWLWNLMMESTYNRAEPGVLFMDRANEIYPANYANKLIASNPCFTADTKVAVADGRGEVSFEDLVKDGKDVPVYCYDTLGNVVIRTMRNPRVTAHNKDIYKVILSNGMEIKATSNHKFLLENKTLTAIENIKVGDNFVIAENKDWDVISPINHKVTGKVEKTCECCGSTFIVEYSKREQSYCSTECLNSATEFNIVQYKMFDTIATVEKIELVSNEDVYNGTVDEFHNFFVGENNRYVCGTNCGEQLLGAYQNCLLSSINLTQFYDGKTFNFGELQKVTTDAVRFLDDVNDLTDAPLPQHVENLKKYRRIGLGIMGWGSLLYMMKIPFASKAADELRDKIMSTITHNAINYSVDLAIEKGAFLECVPEKHAKSVFYKNINLPEDTIERIRKHGIRNSTLFSIQPTGSSGITANIVSGGLEPVFMPEYIRTTIQQNVPDTIKDLTPKYWEGQYHETELFKWTKEGDEDILRGEFDGVVYKIDKSRGLTKEVECMDYGVRWLKERGEWDASAEWAKTTVSLTAEEHLSDLAGFSRFLDSSCSKCVEKSTTMVIIDGEIRYLNELDFSDEEDTFTDYNGQTMTHNGIMANVKSLYNNGNKQTIKIVFDDGSSIVCTPTHKIYTTNGWVKAEDIKIHMAV